ncbi:TRAP transporter substrate-binding protein DctP [Nocardioides sp. NPDC051685]|uniref:TRAP transporter substrate-binding protein DctP n=1 Tax=Nocardioides sp. NPDC051685 TaxID=3364334 RepID=UPI0037B3FCD7
MAHITKPLAAVIAGLSAIAVLTACQGGAARNTGASIDGMEPIELTFSDIQADASTAGRYRTMWMDRVTELTNRKVTFKLHGNGTLHPADEALSALQSGLTDATFISNGYFPDQLPISNWDDKVVQANTVELGYPAVNIAGIPAMVEHYDQGGAVAKETASQGFVPMLPMFSGPAVLHCSEAFSDPADLKGRQVRVANDVAKGENAALGMTGVFLDPTEQYEGLQRGVIDCAVNAATTVLGLGLLEVAPYSSFTENAPTSGAYYAVSKEVWDSLPDDVRDAMIQARNEAVVEFLKNTLETYKQYAEAAEGAGHKLIDPAPLNEAIRAWRDSTQDVALAAPSNVSAPEDEVKADAAIVEEWKGFVENELGVPVGTPESFAKALEAFNAGSAVVEDWDKLLEKLNTETTID